MKFFGPTRGSRRPLPSRPRANRTRCRYVSNFEVTSAVGTSPPYPKRAHAMSFSKHLIAQVDAELHASRRVIERIPESMLEWAPHEKSMDAKTLATHVANLISWGEMIATTEELDFQSDQMKNWSPPEPDTVEEIVQLLDENAEKVKGLLDGMSDEELQ